MQCWYVLFGDWFLQYFIVDYCLNVLCSKLYYMFIQIICVKYLKWVNCIVFLNFDNLKQIKVFQLGLVWGGGGDLWFFFLYVYDK